MKLLVFFLLFFYINTAYSSVDVNKCDNLVKKSEKISCLTKLKAQAVKENSKKKANIIQDKLSNFHNKLNKGVTDTEDGIAKVGKKIGKGKTQAEQGIKDKANKSYIYIKSIFKKDKTD